MVTTSEFLMSKVAEVSPGIFNYMSETAEEVRQSPFRAEILENLDGILKKAAAVAGAAGALAGAAAPVAQGLIAGIKNPMARNLAYAGAGVGATIATSIAINLAGDAYDALRRGLTKGRNYKKMIQANPDLKGMPSQHTMRAFSTLHRFNPEFSGDPYVAGSWVRNQVEQAAGERGQINLGELTGLISSRQHLTNIRKLPMVGKLPWETSSERQMNAKRMMQMDASMAPDPLLALKERQLIQQTDEGIFGHRKEQEALRVRQLQDMLEPSGVKRRLDVENLTRAERENDPDLLARAQEIEEMQHNLNRYKARQMAQQMGSERSSAQSLRDLEREHARLKRERGKQRVVRVPVRTSTDEPW